MSTVPPAPSLSDALVDDAAVFPPESATVARAWAAYTHAQRGPYAASIGPLLIATGDVAELAEVARAEGAPSPVNVVVIGRPGTSVLDTARALETAEAILPSHVVVAGAEIAHQPGWEHAMAWGVPLAIEVPHTLPEQAAALSALAGATVRAKLRTQSTATTPVPSTHELAHFIAACHLHGLPFKLTGGLHRAVAHTTPTTLRSTTLRSAIPRSAVPEDQHGVLNVMLATHLMATGGGLDEARQALLSRDARALAIAVSALASNHMTAMRAYG